jgi:hypothetical protein
MEEVQEAIESPAFIRPILLQGCRRLLKTKRKECHLAEIWALDTYAVIRISITRDECPSILQSTLEWFLQREEYEECAECQRLITAFSSKGFIAVS